MNVHLRIFLEQGWIYRLQRAICKLVHGGNTVFRGNGTRGHDVGYYTGEEFLLALISLILSSLVSSIDENSTYRSQSINLPRALAPHILWNTVKVENKRRKGLSIMSLPLPYRIERLSRRPLIPHRSRSGRPLLFPRSV